VLLFFERREEKEGEKDEIINLECSAYILAQQEKRGGKKEKERMNSCFGHQWREE